MKNSLTRENQNRRHPQTSIENGQIDGGLKQLRLRTAVNTMNYACSKQFLIIPYLDTSKA